ncbi:hypothetical protein GZH47_23455 [Paenibacillus rhizovicinus]|uniref:Uncharacterized protein n=1 Tax=Paenibacillus rhizovicinus TaxID=2704463 RepID=A0A6C0P539_9BACL|nr:hypothetical protein [Paenibacillus rhizovicinus]QHW33461.1 hypothetical protein GZH47_23455 [Paenibacillus rhizovicinus]
MTKLPQLYALQLERLIAHGLREERILELLRSGSEAELAALVNPEVKWERLITYAQDNRQTLEKAVRHGYSFPFITIGGIKSLLAIKFGRQEAADYSFGGDRIEGLRLHASEHDLLRAMLPSYWVFTRAAASLPDDNVEISIALRGLAESRGDGNAGE